MTQCVSINNWPSLSAFSYRETFIQKREAQNSLEIRSEKSIHGAKTIEKKVERNHAQDWPHLPKDWTFLTWLLFHLLTCYTLTWEIKSLLQSPSWPCPTNYSPLQDLLKVRLSVSRFKEVSEYVLRNQTHLRVVITAMERERRRCFERSHHIPNSKQITMYYHPNQTVRNGDVIRLLGRIKKFLPRVKFLEKSLHRTLNETQEFALLEAEILAI